MADGCHFGGQQEGIIGRGNQGYPAKQSEEQLEGAVTDLQGHCKHLGFSFL